jgi:hypothetical protein
VLDDIRIGQNRAERGGTLDSGGRDLITGRQNCRENLISKYSPRTWCHAWHVQHWE